MSNQIIKIDHNDYEVEETKAKEVTSMFLPMLQKMEDLESEFNKVVKLEVSKDSCKAAKELRLKYVKVRTGTAEIHKKLKAESLKVGRFLDGFKNAQIMASSGIEEKLSNIEKHFERIEEQRIEELRLVRENELSEYEVAVMPSNLGAMEQSVYDAFLIGTRANFEAVKEAEKQAEIERIEAEKKAIQKAKEEAEEQARIKAENEKLRKEAAEKEAIRQAEIAKAEKQRAKEQAIADAKIKEANDKLAAEKQKAIAAQKKIEDEKAEIEAQNQLAAKLAYKKEAIRLEAEKQKQAAPDKEKMLALIQLFENIEYPNTSTDHGAFIIDQVKGLISKTCKYIEDASTKF